MKARTMEMICRLKQVRLSRKLSQGQIAELVGVKRQAIYDIESGRYLPNTEVALRLARHLGCRVEDLFSEALPASHTGVTLTEQAVSPTTRVSVVKVRDRLVGYPLQGSNSFGQGFQAAEGLLEAYGKKVTLFESLEQLGRTALLLGCDPAFGILAAYVNRYGSEGRLQWRFASSHQALRRLAAGEAHLAATHMHDSGSGESNVTLAKKMLGGTPATVIAFAHFEEGLMVARGNPRNISNASDLAKDNVRIVNREPGAALRTLLDERLALAGIPAQRVIGYNKLVSTHEEGAQMVAYGLADAALGLRAVAFACGLDFVTMETVRCDIVIPRDMMEHRAVLILVDILQTRMLRNELTGLPGYDAADTGRVIGTL